MFDSEHPGGGAAGKAADAIVAEVKAQLTAAGTGNNNGSNGDALPRAAGSPPGESPAGNKNGGSGGGSGGPPGGGKGLFDHPVPEGHAKTMSAVLGEIVWLMSQSGIHKQFFISDLEWFVMTPVLLQQFRLFYAKDRPLGVVFWAFVDDEVEKRLAEGTTKLRPQDWKSGDKLWVVEAITPFGGAEEMVMDLKAKVFPDRTIKMRALSAEGKAGVRVV